MNAGGGSGNKEALKFSALWLDFCGARATVDLKKCARRFSVVGFNFEPNIGMTQVRYFVDPEPVWAELENAAFRFFFNQRQSEGVAIKRNRLVVGVARTFDGRRCAPGRPPTFQLGDHMSILAARDA